MSELKLRPPYETATEEKKGPEPEFGAFCNLSRRRPTFQHIYPCSMIGPARLNFRVRDGNGCDPRGMTTRKLETRVPIPMLIPSKRSRVRQQKLCAIAKRSTFGWHYKFDSSSNTTVQNWRFFF